MGSAQNKWPWLLLLLSLSPSPCITSRPSCLRASTAVDKNQATYLLTSATPTDHQPLLTMFCVSKNHSLAPALESGCPQLFAQNAPLPLHTDPSPALRGLAEGPPCTRPHELSTSRSGAIWAQRPYLLLLLSPSSVLQTPLQVKPLFHLVAVTTVGRSCPQGGSNSSSYHQSRW